MSDLVIHWRGRLVLTTAQAAARLEIQAGSFRGRMTRHGIRPATHIDPRTPLWYPEDLGLEQS